MRVCLDKHPTPTETESKCRLCWLSLHVRQYQRLWGIPATGEYETASDAKKPVGPPIKLQIKQPCNYAVPLSGEQREIRNLTHLKSWQVCTHPDLPLKSEIVCPCQGCGEACKGYTSEDYAEFL